ncbi:Bypass of stop codon protein 6-like protein 3 [Colletotrichum chlorophyti]|uniref:Bypass of stop codon protein 6-like protein 3 n=1 Tax=Colletotrichum chlorophyti TaxID=708187 RepID=A0A1Q8RQS6_9PEZI|nr:Bypass of stop codon protein 6-like protein 3 [Colletotrichum chlorophyti]
MTAHPTRTASQNASEREPLLRPRDGEIRGDTDPTLHGGAINPVGQTGDHAEAQADTDGKALEEDGIAFRAAAAAWSFVVLGLFVASVGATIYQLQRHYKLSDIQVSTVFLVGPVGYSLAAWFNHSIHRKLGQRGVAIIGPSCHLFYAVVACLHPPFPILLVAAVVGCFGGGLLDGSWCAWFAALKHANTLSGLLHGSFSIGAGLCPYVAALLLSNEYFWYQLFYVLIAASVVELLVLLWAFRKEDAAKYHRYQRTQLSPSDQADAPAVLRYKATWVYAAFLLAYVGTECTISGWVAAFMLRVRFSSVYAANICLSCFWIGMAAGRLILGTVTDRFGPRRAVVVYLLLAPPFVVLFILVRVLWVSAMSISLLGFIMGPLFPSSIVQLVQFLPKGSHVTAVSLVATVGQAGGALFPYVVGVITEFVGLWAFQWMILLQFAVLLLIWVLSLRLPGTQQPDDDENDRLSQE